MRRNRARVRAGLALLVLTAVALITIDVRAGAASPLQDVRERAGDVVGPAQQVLGTLARPVSAVVERVGGLGEDRERVADLEQENQELRRQVASSDTDRRRAAELDALLRVAGLGQYRTVPARVVAYGPGQGFAWTATVDAGAQDGIRPDMTVLNGQGLVGRVKTVSASTATVVLVSDPSVNVGVRLEAGTLGFSSGNGADPISVDLVDPAAPVAVGDRMLTFGSREGTPFVAGVPFGEVVEVQGITSSLAKRVKVDPYADLGALDLVGVVVQPPRENPRESVLPPRPAPPSPPAAEPAPSGPVEAPAGRPSGKPSEKAGKPEKPGKKPPEEASRKPSGKPSPRAVDPSPQD